MLATILIAVGFGLALLAMAIMAAAVAVRKRPSTPESDSPVSEQGEQISSDIEILILDETLQLNNYGDCSIRIQGSSIEGVSILYPSDVWVRKFDSRHPCHFQLSIVQHQTMIEENLVELKVSAAEVAVRPVAETHSVYYTMWKLKPTVYLKETHVIEHRIFAGQLLKTVNFSRAPSRYYKVRAATRPHMTLNGLYSGSNIGCKILGSGRLQLMSTRIEPRSSAAMNLSDRMIKANIVQPTSGDSLNRRLGDRMQNVPGTGVYSFYIRPKRSETNKDLLRMRLTDQSVSIEPPTKFGSLPLFCEIDLLDRQGGRAKKIVSAELLSELQLPRKSYTYVVTFSVSLGDEETTRDGETSCTLE